MIFTGAVACTTEKGSPGQKVDSIREHQSKSIITAGNNREKLDTTKEVVPERVVVENNWLSEKESRQLDEKLAACKAAGKDCRPVLQEYIDISNKHSQELREACTAGGITCVGWEELIQAETNVANDAHPLQIRFSEKLKDPDAAALVNYLNRSDLKFLNDNITDGDRAINTVLSPTT